MEGRGGEERGGGGGGGSCHRQHHIPHLGPKTTAASVLQDNRVQACVSGSESDAGVGRLHGSS